MEESLANLSFTDIYLLKEFFKINYKYLEKNKIDFLNSDKEEKEQKENNNKKFALKTNIKKIELKIVDDYSNNYFPFLNFKLLNSNLTLSNKNELSFSNYIILSTYNYIASNWEPIIERTFIKGSNIKKQENKSEINSAKIEISNILINISDMLISSVFISIKNFSKIVEGNELFNINNKIEDKETISKISLSVNSEISSGIDNEIDILSRKNSGTNSNIANYTGIPLKFKLNNKIYYCDIDTETNLLNNNYEKYENSLIQILYEKDKIINIPFRSLENNIYKVNDIDFLVWEKIITKNRQININIYSKYIFKNKTNCSFQIKLLNPKLEILFILLKPNSYSGIPLTYCNEETSFNFKLIKNEVDISNNESSIINLKEVINNEKYYKKINMKNGSFILKLQHKIEKVKTILLTSEYKIIMIYLLKEII